MSPIRESEKQQILASLKSLSDFFNKKGLHFESQSKEKGFNVSEFAMKTILNFFASKEKVKLLPAEVKVITEVFLGERNIESLKSLKLMPAFRRICFEIARHEQFLIEQGLRGKHVELNNILRNSMAKLLGRMIEIYKPKIKQQKINPWKPLEIIELEQDPLIWEKARKLEALAKSWKKMPGMQTSVKMLREKIKKMKEIAIKRNIKPLLMQTRQLRRQLTPKLKRR